MTDNHGGYINLSLGSHSHGAKIFTCILSHVSRETNPLPLCSQISNSCIDNASFYIKVDVEMLVGTP